MEEKSNNLDKIEKIIGMIWVIVLVILWIFYPFFPGDIFFWMGVAIIWSIGGGIMGLSFYLIKRKKSKR